MANLIPPEAKKEVVTEYWIRVGTVWCALIGVAFLTLIALKVPTLVLIESQLTAFSGKYTEAINETEQFAHARAAIDDANELGALLSEDVRLVRLSELREIIDEIAGSAVTVKSFTFTRDGGVVESIAISGVGNTRTALAAFTKNLEAHPLFTRAELPISNLASEQDIAFSITIEPADSSSE